MIEHVSVESDNVMQSYHMPFRHPQGPVWEWPYNFHEVVDNCPFILRCEEWAVIPVFWIVEPLGGDFL